ncbi:MAG: hypothetical protein K1X83_06185 [Oligoflexia bacterium]|nr:hypothetical protein [Oligoflexia bacterium]
MKFRAVAAMIFLPLSLWAQSAVVTPAPAVVSDAQIEARSRGCLDCHLTTDAPSMHSNPAVRIGCADCHGGDPGTRARGLTRDSREYQNALAAAHVRPENSEVWEGSGNPERPYTETLKASLEFIKFVNPGDLRVARETCGGCHAKIVDGVERSLMTTSAMLWGGASYNNNILPFKRYVLGESYYPDGTPREVLDPGVTPELAARGALKKLIPLPQWESVSPGDVFRVFERGGLFIKSQFPEIGNPNPLEDAGRPDIKSSNRGLGTGSRIAVPVINILKTRLNDPHLSLMGTNDHPGDYRSSGCTGCHSVYANDLDPRHSGPYAAFGHSGFSGSSDPTIPRNEKGHPVKHEFTRAIPTSQCMVCHMHQPNMFVNSYLGYTMWDYEADAPAMWPKEQRYPTIEERFKSYQHNPEGAAARGLWSNEEFLEKVSSLNPDLKHTQFADYHGHGWNFRAIFKRDRKGHLLDAKGREVLDSDPKKFQKAVHMADIHVDKGMHCVDCHFQQDSHGDGHIYGEVAQAVEIQCQDCHGTVKEYATLKTSGPAAPQGGTDLALQRTAFGVSRFFRRAGVLYQRSSVTPGLEWAISQVRDSVNPTSAHYNAKAARAKLLGKFKGAEESPALVKVENLAKDADTSQILAHSDEKMSCFSCHSSWVTSCAGCHLPIEANWKQKSKHYDGKTTRNWATYNPQVARDEMFQLGLHGPVKGNRIVPVRSSSALVLSSTDINRQIIYAQQPPTAASGHSSQAFAPHFPHTVRKTETKQCEDCHVSKANDNNAIMAQLLLLGTNFVNFMGYHAFVAAGEGGVEAVQVTEWDEPQAVIGSYLHRYAFPDNFAKHQAEGMELQHSEHHAAEGGPVNTIQQRGEYLYTTAGRGGFRVFDVANVSNKGFSERITTSPVSPLGQDTHVATKNATSFALPTTMPVAPFRAQGAENMETPLHPIYHYAVITDSEEGLILVNVDTLQDRDPENNFLGRAVTWNPEGVLDGARFVTLAGSNAFVLTAGELKILDLDDPMKPRIVSSLPLKDPRAVAIQFRYAFVTTASGLEVLDITDLEHPVLVPGASVPLKSASNLYLARTYAYVADGPEGLAIVDIERPDQPKLYQLFDAAGALSDVRDVKVATTNASLFGYVADGKNGLKVLQLTDPESVPGTYGFSPSVKPRLIAWRKLAGPATALSKPLDRDRAVDETGHQVSIFGRIGSRPFSLPEMQHFYLRKDKTVYRVHN